VQSLYNVVNCCHVSLQAGAWPIPQNNLPAFAIPQELERSVRMVSTSEYTAMALLLCAVLVNTDFTLSVIFYVSMYVSVDDCSLSSSTISTSVVASCTGYTTYALVSRLWLCNETQQMFENVCYTFNKSCWVDVM
jgi:hypothetical protein